MGCCRVMRRIQLSVARTYTALSIGSSNIHRTACRPASIKRRVNTIDSAVSAGTGERNDTLLMDAAGAPTLSDVSPRRLTLACSKCGRRGSYAVRRLIDQHGDPTLIRLLEKLSADCPK